jgi:hypothetical protein
MLARLKGSSNTFPANGFKEASSENVSTIDRITTKGRTVMFVDLLFRRKEKQGISFLKG